MILEQIQQNINCCRIKMVSTWCYFSVVQFFCRRSWNFYGKMLGGVGKNSSATEVTWCPCHMVLPYTLPSLETKALNSFFPNRERLWSLPSPQLPTQQMAQGSHPLSRISSTSFSSPSTRGHFPMHSDRFEPDFFRLLVSGMLLASLTYNEVTRSF